MTTALATLALVVALYNLATARRTRVTTSRNAERAVTAAVAARAAKDEAGRLANEYANWRG